jgi:acetyltransferase
MVRQKQTSDVTCLNQGLNGFSIRALRSDDAAAYSEFIARTSAEDVRRRFPANRAKQSAQRFFAPPLNTADVAVVVRDVASGIVEIIGEARAQRESDGTTAELGILVRTDFQRRGVGRALLEKMIDHCVAQGIDLIGQIAADNTEPVALARASGMHVEPFTESPT